VSQEPPVVLALRQFLRFLADRRVAYALLGGFAVRALALPRPTFDLDVLVGVSEADVAPLAQAAEDAGFVVGDEFRRGFVEKLGGLSKFHVSAQFGTRFVRIDVFVLGSEYQREVFARRQEQQDSQLGPLSFISPEDLLLHKLLADRPRDRADVADLLLVAGPLDMDYVRTWAGKLGLTGRLERALRDARLG
jgi:hypothetical protein